MANIKSMTGYGVAKTVTPSSYIEVNLRSVNGRFLETRIHLPREFISVESEIKKKLESVFQRGTVDVLVSKKSRGEKSDQKLFLHEEIAKAWMVSAEKLKAMAETQKVSIQGQLSLGTLLQLPQVVSFEEEASSIEHDAQVLLKMVEEACASCLAEREREGRALHSELVRLLQSLDQLVQSMNEARGEINQMLKDRMDARLKTRWTELEMDPHRLQSEWAILWDKADITEELTRLKEHLHHYRQLLDQTKVQGKKLDFYTQELLREINTIGSKSPSVALTQLVVNAKTEIEKLREQVQNIE